MFLPLFTIYCIKTIVWLLYRSNVKNFISFPDVLVALPFVNEEIDINFFYLLIGSSVALKKINTCNDFQSLLDDSGETPTTFLFSLIFDLPCVLIKYRYRKRLHSIQKSFLLRGIWFFIHC